MIIKKKKDLENIKWAIFFNRVNIMVKKEKNIMVFLKKRNDFYKVIGKKRFATEDSKVSFKSKEYRIFLDSGLTYKKKTYFLVDFENQLPYVLFKNDINPLVLTVYNNLCVKSGLTQLIKATGTKKSFADLIIGFIAGGGIVGCVILFLTMYGVIPG